MANAKRPSGATIGEAERRNRGQGSTLYRTTTEALDALAELAGRWGTTKAGAIDRAVSEALKRATRNRPTTTK